MSVLGRIVAALAVILVAACGAKPAAEPASDGIAGLDALPAAPQGPSWAPAPVDANGLRLVAQSGAGGFALHTRHGPVSFLAGVNLGSTTPGHQPGELAITAEDYRRWFPAMARLGVRVVRVYTIHPPSFYQELARYNTGHPDAPLYLMQGVYLPDESYVDSGNLYSTEVTGAFTAELGDAARAVHGKLHRDPRRGRASGDWDTDVGDWLVAWIVGVEWDPNATAASDRRNAAAPGHAGRYFASTPDATPTERWLAARMDELAGAEAGFGRSAPIAFVNWPTADPLRHPEEPLPQEDLVGVDANHVQPTGAWPAGTFASYHAYPYYPDFQRHEPALQRFTYHGRSDPYAGYLDALKRHHAGMPVLVTEFGLPSAIGWAHVGPLGRDQGNHGEADALRGDAELLRLIKDVGLSGGLVFEWSDEWFKFTWNTINHQLPADRRQLWHDELTNEQHFGVLATDPTGFANPDPQVLHQGGTSVTARVDEGYLRLDATLPAEPTGPVVVGLDPLPDLTGSPPPGGTDNNADVAFVLDAAAHAGQVWIRTELDPLPLDYPPPAGSRADPVDGWQRFQLTTNRPLRVPSTGQALPMEFADVGALRWGNWDPAASGYDSRALWRVDGAELHLRIPWALAGLADPSSKQVLAPTAPTKTRTVTGIGLSVAGQPLGTLTWQDWQRVGHRERLKPGATDLRAAMLAVTS